MAVYAVDFETSYTTDRDIKSLGQSEYLRHPETDIYLVAIVGDGCHYVGPPETAPWDEISGEHWVSHNASFDSACFMAAIEKAQIPETCRPEEWDCTANLCALIGAPRSLSGASEQLFGELMDKSVRDEMRNKNWQNLPPEKRAEVEAYALNDAKACYRIWQEYHPYFTPFELALSRHTMEMTHRGVKIDLVRAEQDARTLAAALHEAQEAIPWAKLKDKKGKPLPILSKPQLDMACAQVGIPAPASTADKSEAFALWLEQYGEIAPFVAAVKTYRSVNRTLEVVKKLRKQVSPDGRLRYGLKYYGAHTGRFSGSQGLNFHNLTKKKVAGVDLRGLLIPEPGNKFVVADLKQIEAVVALWFAGDTEQLQLIEQGMDVYEVHARRTMGYTDPRKLEEYVEAPDCPESDRNLRQFAKCRVLGLGFGLGYKKFVQIVKLWTGITITEAESKKLVRDFRLKNPGITKCWEDLEMLMRRHAAGAKAKEPFEIEVPGGSKLRYFDVNLSGGLRARDEMGGVMLHFYGGKLFENVVQHFARRILGESVLRIEGAGNPVVLHVHDEVIAEVPISVPKEVVRDLMIKRPDFCFDLPIRSSCKDAERYFK